MINQDFLHKLINDSLDAIFYVESVDAKKLLQKLKQFINSENIAMNNPELARKLKKLTIRLKIAAFSNLDDAEAEEVLRNHYLESFEISISMENALISRLFFVPFSVRDEVREKLKKALLENEEHLGKLTISEWIQKFESETNVEKRSLSASTEFVDKNKLALELDSTAKRRLQNVLHTYDYLLVSTLPMTEPELSQALNSLTPEDLDDSFSDKDYFGIEQGEQHDENTLTLEKILLSDAIKKYPEAGEQLITSQKIELKNFHEPVRPSIKNWLADYVHLLGYEEHDAIERGNFLFHTTNARRLSEPDRERLAYILKVFDEKTPVDIDPVRKIIVFNFPPKIPVKAPAVQLSPRYSPSISNTKPVQQINHFAPVSKSVPSPTDDYIVRPLPRGEVELTRPVSPATRQYVPTPQASRQFSQTNQTQKTQSDPPDIYESYRINEAEPEQKLSAGKIFSPKIDSNIQEAKFDFPQRMPFEKEREKKPAPSNSDLQPYRITSSSYRRDDTQKKPDINPNNIIDLKNPQ